MFDRWLSFVQGFCLVLSRARENNFLFDVICVKVGNQRIKWYFCSSSIFHFSQPVKPKANVCVKSKKEIENDPKIFCELSLSSRIHHFYCEYSTMYFHLLPL